MEFMEILDNVLGLFMDKRTIEKNKEQRENRKHTKIAEENVDRQVKINECTAALERCERCFERTIIFERQNAKDMRNRGYSDQKQREIVRQAAIGLMVVDRAKLELRSVATEESFNSAVNMLGQALGQIRRLDKTNPVVSEGMVKLLQSWSSVSWRESDAAKDPLANFMIPPETAERINPSFVDGLMAGKSFYDCMYSPNQVHYDEMKPIENPDVHTYVIPDDQENSNTEGNRKAFEIADII